MNKLISRILKLITLPICLIPTRIRNEIIFQLIRGASCNSSSKEALKYLLELDRRIYFLTGQAAKRYGGGIHTKHRHIKYHDFFIKNMDAGTRILDVGCGNGFLAYDIATNVDNAEIIGVDSNSENIAFAKEKFDHPSITFKVGEAPKDLPDQRFDVVILSNVLEHIEKRVEFLNGR